MGYRRAMRPNRRGPASKPDRRTQPAYAVAEAARYLSLPPATLRSWVLGRRYDTASGIRRFSAIVDPASRRPLLLSFWNLVECHVLRALRTDHHVPLREVRLALAFAQGQLGIPNLLPSKDLLAGGGGLFLERYGQLIDLSASGQLAMRRVLEDHLRRVEWDAKQFPVRLYPFVFGEASTGQRPIAIDPAVAFGRPIMVARGVTTAIVVERVDAGESIVDVAADYDLTETEIEQAILYERAA